MKMNKNYMIITILGGDISKEEWEKIEEIISVKEFEEKVDGNFENPKINDFNYIYEQFGDGGTTWMMCYSDDNMLLQPDLIRM